MHRPKMLPLDRPVAKGAGGNDFRRLAPIARGAGKERPFVVDFGIEPVDQLGQGREPFILAALRGGLFPQFGELRIAHHVQHGVARLVEQQIVGLAGAGEPLRPGPRGSRDSAGPSWLATHSAAASSSQAKSDIDATARPRRRSASSIPLQLLERPANVVDRLDARRPVHRRVILRNCPPPTRP